MATAGGVNTYDEAVVSAQKENKLLLVELTSKDCHFCDYMKKRVFNSRIVKEAIEKNYVFIRYDVLEDRIPDQFTSVMTPTYYFVSSDGKKIVDEVPGAMKKVPFAEYLDEVARQELK
jgi:thioredoxin-related protein